MSSPPPTHEDGEQPRRKNGSIQPYPNLQTLTYDQTSSDGVPPEIAEPPLPGYFPEPLDTTKPAYCLTLPDRLNRENFTSEGNKNHQQLNGKF